MSDQNQTSTVEQVRPREAKPQNQPKRQPPYQLVVLNDNDHTFAYVIEGLVRFCGHDVEKAYELAATVHHTGRAIVWSGMLETAELKRDQLRGMGPDFYAPKVVNYPLGVLLEPMPQ